MARLSSCAGAVAAVNLICLCLVPRAAAMRDSINISTATKSLEGKYHTRRYENLTHLYIQDKQCSGLVDQTTLEEACSGYLITTVSAEVLDDFPPADLSVHLDFAADTLPAAPLWSVTIYRRTAQCRGDAPVAVRLGCEH